MKEPATLAKATKRQLLDAIASLEMDFNAQIARTKHLVELAIAKDFDRLNEIATQIATGTELRFRDMHIQGGEITVNGSLWALPQIAKSLALSLRKPDGEMWNFIEQKITDWSTGTTMVITLQRVTGKTPGDMKADAERERDELREECARLRKRVAELEVA